MHQSDASECIYSDQDPVTSQHYTIHIYATKQIFNAQMGNTCHQSIHEVHSNLLFYTIFM